ncbi:MAG: DUF2905 domain-containing protein [Pseudomonadota bacterium]|nr:MAG: DUF2905 domain-containing protein [Pseudomonadota bacterium]
MPNGPGASPPPSPPIGPILIGVGLTIVVIGLLVWSGALSWFGRLPGDIRYESDHTRVYVPITSMIVVSVALTLLLSLVRRLF